MVTFVMYAVWFIDKAINIYMLCIVVYALMSWFPNAYGTAIDINPSIQIDMDRNDKVKRIKALNSDAKEVIKGIEKGGNLGDTINSITRKAVEKDYVKCITPQTRKNKKFELTKKSKKIMEKLNELIT